MPGGYRQQVEMLCCINPEPRVPQNHPLRPLRRMVDGALEELSPRFERLYSHTGRPSIPPKKLPRALLLQILYTIRSERMLMEQFDYNLLFRWFVGLNMDDGVWAPTVFTKNRDRLLDGDIARAFFDKIIEQDRREKLLSDDHFTVDGALIDAWAGQNSFKPKDSNMYSMIDGRTRRHSGYEISQRKRKRVEEIFGWLKPVGLKRKTRNRGVERVRWMFLFAAAAYTTWCDYAT